MRIRYPRPHPELGELGILLPLILFPLLAKQAWDRALNVSASVFLFEIKKLESRERERN